MTQEVLVNIDVDDLAKAIAFYQGAFDLTIGRRLGAFGVELIGASSAIYLLAKPAEPARPRRSSARATMPATGHRCISTSS